MVRLTLNKMRHCCRATSLQFQTPVYQVCAQPVAHAPCGCIRARLLRSEPFEYAALFGLLKQHLLVDMRHNFDLLWKHNILLVHWSSRSHSSALLHCNSFHPALPPISCSTWGQDNSTYPVINITVFVDLDSYN